MYNLSRGAQRELRKEAARTVLASAYRQALVESKTLPDDISNELLKLGSAQ